MRELNETEYNELIGIYSVNHFMGGVSGSDTSKEIYLVRGKIYLLDSTDDPSQLLIEQEKEAREWMEDRQ